MTPREILNRIRLRAYELLVSLDGITLDEAQRLATREVARKERHQSAVASNREHRRSGGAFCVSGIKTDE